MPTSHMNFRGRWLSLGLGPWTILSHSHLDIVYKYYFPGTGFLSLSYIPDLLPSVDTLNLGAFIFSQAHIYGNSFALFLKIIHCIPLYVIFHQLSSQRVTVHPELVLKILHNWNGTGTSQSEQIPAVKQKDCGDPQRQNLSLAGAYLPAKLAYDSILVPIFI